MRVMAALTVLMLWTSAACVGHGSAGTESPPSFIPATGALAGCYQSELGQWDMPPELPAEQTPPGEFVIEAIQGDSARLVLKPRI